MTASTLASNLIASLGNVVTYTYGITNTGTVTLSNLAAIDNRLGAVPLGANVLAPGTKGTGVLTYLVQASDLPGPLANTMVVSATSAGGNPVQAQADATVDLVITDSIFLPLVNR
jgi:hypothetical protein